MEPLHFIIAILGCGEADAACEPVQTLPARYESRADCMEATEAALMKSGDVPYPVVVAQCMAEGKAPPRLSPAEVELPRAPDANPVDLRSSPVRG